MSDAKPRERYFQEANGWLNEVSEAWKDDKDTFNYIEFSAFEAKCAELEALKPHPVEKLWKDKYYDKCTELNAAEAKLAVAVKLLKEGKRKFTPNTTNSDVDCFIADNEIKGDSDG